MNPTSDPTIQARDVPGFVAMNVAIVGDAHLIHPDDPHEGRRSEREMFVEAWPSFARLIRTVNDSDAERVILTGDLVDYYSRHNRDYALELLSRLDVPWAMTPGNHDFQVINADSAGSTITTDRSAAAAGWDAADVPLGNRAFDVGDVRILLVDSALSAVAQSDLDWVATQTATDRECILCTHVPLDHPAVVRAITAREPARRLEKYVQRGTPTVFQEVVAGKISMVFSGHLHFRTAASVGNTRQHVLPLSIRRECPRYTSEGGFCLIDTTRPVSIEWARPPDGSGIEQSPSRPDPASLTE